MEIFVDLVKIGVIIFLE